MAATAPKLTSIAQFADSALRELLDQDRLGYALQPIQPLGGQSVRWYELLIRPEWEGARIPANAFVRAVEQRALAQRLDRTVLCRGLEILADHPEIERLGVNISGLSVCPLFLDDVTEEIALSGVDPSRLCIEITETEPITNEAAAHSFGAALSRLGVRLALDDLGVGTPSLFYLTFMPVDIIKIDGQFIRNLPESRPSQAIVKALADLARTMNLELVGEGVETEAQYRWCRRLGLDFVQGYHVGVPTSTTNNRIPAPPVRQLRTGRRS